MNSLKPDIDFAVDEGPLMRRAQPFQHLVEHWGMLGRIFEKRDEVERLAEIAAVAQPARDRRRIVQSDRGVMRRLLENRVPFTISIRSTGGKPARRTGSWRYNETLGIGGHG